MRLAPLLLLLPLCSCIKPFDLNLRAGYIDLEPSGDIGLDDSANSQSLGDIKIDIDDDFGLQEADSPYLRADWDPGSWRVSLSGFKIDDASDSVLSETFGDIPAGSSVRSDMEIFNTKLSATYNLIKTPWAQVGVGAAINYFAIDLDVVSVAPVVAYERIDFDAPVPMLYAQASAELSMFRGDLELGWLSVELPDAKGSFWDLDASISVAPLPYLEIFAGYRYISLNALGEADGQDFDTDLKLDGLYFGGGVTF